MAMGCSQTPEPEFRLVGLYDASAVVSLDAEAPQTFMWQPSEGMKESCGPSKGPDGIGLYDAELIANRMSPTLAIVLEHSLPIDEYLTELTSPNVEFRRPAVTNGDVTIALGIEDGKFVLQPAVLPRNIMVEIAGDETNLRYQQLVRTQVEVEMCMEHKVGRGWAGANQTQLRQAFLLRRADEDGTNDRRYFGGQRDPVAPYLGPSDACLNISSSLLETTMAAGGKGEGSTDLVPSDIWGAALRECGNQLALNAQVGNPSPMVPLTITEHGDTQARQPPQRWSEMVIQVSPGTRDEDISVSVSYEDKRLGEQWEPSLMVDQPLFEFQDELEDGRRKGGMVDLLKDIPHIYPTVGPRYDPDRYVVLMIPNWQLVEGLRRIFGRTCPDVENRCFCEVTSRDGAFTCKDDYNETCTPSDEAQEACLEDGNFTRPLRFMPPREFDGVGWILENPELLFIQVDSMELEQLEPSQMNPYDRFVESYNESCTGYPWPFRCKKDDEILSCDDDMSDSPELLFNCEHINDAGTEMLCDVQTSASEPPSEEIACSASRTPSLTMLSCGASRRYTCQERSQKPNLAVVTQGGFKGIQDWGYVAGQKVGRTPIVLPIDEAGTWPQAKEAQRSRQHTLFLFMMGIMFGFLIFGIRRLPDLWTRTPEERAYYWPGRQSQEEQENVDPEGVEASAESNEEG
jgi:hypothetical protein